MLKVNNNVTILAILNFFLAVQAGIWRGGMNSLSEAMVCGVPMPVIPFVSDQPVNAEQAALLGLDRILKYNDITADSLKAAARHPETKILNGSL